MGLFFLRSLFCHKLDTNCDKTIQKIGGQKKSPAGGGSNHEIPKELAAAAVFRERGADSDFTLVSAKGI